MKREQTSQPDLDIAGKLELADWEFKTIMIKMLKALKINYTVCKNRWAMQAEREILRGNQKEMLEI